ncbi:MAG: DUF1697 domain-containing protein, partial [Sphingobacteriales bacterium]
DRRGIPRFFSQKFVIQFARKLIYLVKSFEKFAIIIIIKKILEEAMSTHFSYEAFLFIRDEKEINAIFNNDPFQPIENFHNYIFIGTGKVEELLLEEFQKADKEEGEQGQVIDNVFYWQVPKGQTLNSAFGKILGRKNLKDQMTSRNSNTFEKIIRKFS